VTGKISQGQLQAQSSNISRVALISGVMIFDLVNIFLADCSFTTFDGNLIRVIKYSTCTTRLYLGNSKGGRQFGPNLKNREGSDIEDFMKRERKKGGNWSFADLTENIPALHLCTIHYI